MIPLHAVSKSNLSRNDCVDKTSFHACDLRCACKCACVCTQACGFPYNEAFNLGFVTNFLKIILILYK